MYSLWFAVMVVIFAVGFIYIVNSVIKEGQIVYDDVDATLKAYSVLNSLMFSIATGDLKRKAVVTKHKSDVIPQKNISLDGKEYKSGIENTYYIVQDSNGLIVLEAKKVQANRLRRLLVNKGVNKKKSVIIIDSFLDWIDTNDTKRLNGAENYYYESEKNLGYHPRNRPLEYKVEFYLIRGVSMKIYKKISPYVTIYPNTGFNPNTAPIAVLEAVLKIDKQGAEDIIKYRKDKEIRGDNDLKLLGIKPIERDRTEIWYRPDPTLIIRVKSKSRNVVHKIDCVVNFLETPKIPFSIYEWKE